MLIKRQNTITLNMSPSPAFTFKSGFRRVNSASQLKGLKVKSYAYFLYALWIQWPLKSLTLITIGPMMPALKAFYWARYTSVQISGKHVNESKSKYELMFIQMISTWLQSQIKGWAGLFRLKVLNVTLPLGAFQGSRQATRLFISCSKTIALAEHIAERSFFNFSLFLWFMYIITHHFYARD